jgi:hypothetical protein
MLEFKSKYNILIKAIKGIFIINANGNAYI